MRRVEQQIVQVRRASENVRTGTQDGIIDEEFIQYLNDAQELCQEAIIGAKATVFATQATIYPDGTEYLSLPSDIFADQRVYAVEYSYSGLDQDYRPLKKVRFLERRSFSGLPQQYIIRGNKIIVNAFPSSAIGSYRVTYDQKLPRLDKLRGLVASRTYSTLSLSALTITPSGLFSQGDYSLDDYICLLKVDLATVEMKGIFFTAVNSSGVLTLPTFTAQTGETATVGSWVLLGKNSVNRCQLNDLFEKLMIAYATRRIMDRDSSEDAKTMTMDERAMLASLVSTYGELSGDEDQIPITNLDYFDPDELG